MQLRSMRVNCWLFRVIVPIHFFFLLVVLSHAFLFAARCWRTRFLPFQFFKVLVESEVPDAQGWLLSSGFIPAHAAALMPEPCVGPSRVFGSR